MSLIIIIFSIAVLCTAVSYGIIYGMEFISHIDGVDNYAAADKPLIKKLVFKLGLCIFGLLSGIVLFFYGFISAMF